MFWGHERVWYVQDMVSSLQWCSGPVMWGADGELAKDKLENTGWGQIENAL